LNETCTEAQSFLNAIFDSAGLELRAAVDTGESGCFLNIEGADSSLLLSEGGELLEALQHILNQAFGRVLTKDERIVCDVENFRATREAELRAMARHAAERVRTSGVPFTFGPMNPNERRVIHLALSTEEDLHTESVGEGNARRLKVSQKPSPRQ
jgi:spoIIIJ-associated protein